MVQIAFSALMLALAASVQSSPFSIHQNSRRAADFTSLPATPNLPSPISTQTFARDGANLWYQKYNEAAGGTPIVLIHGGLGYSAYFGDVITILQKSHYVIAVDRRGHGRSTYQAGETFTFTGFADDTYALLKAEGVTSANIVGWSDGAATTLQMLQNSTIDAMINKAFVFAGFQKPGDTNSTFTSTAIYNTFVTRCASEYATNQPSANFTDFATRVGTLEADLPQFSDADLGKINGAKVQIVGADHDEAVNLAVPAHLNSVISGSSLVMLTSVSHFAPVQDAPQFASAIQTFVGA